MQGIEHTIGRLIETSLSDGVDSAHSSYIATVLYGFELIVINPVYSAQCTVLYIRPDDCLGHR